MTRLAEEVLVFARLAAFGLVVGAIYWFVSYEPAGTVLLIGFGIATAVVTAILWARSRRKVRGVAAEWPLGGDPDPIPAPAYAPFHIGVGAAIMALGLAFGPLLLVTGLVIVVIGARYWLEAAMRESDASEARDRHGRPPS